MIRITTMMIMMMMTSRCLFKPVVSASYEFLGGGDHDHDDHHDDHHHDDHDDDDQPLSLQGDGISQL